MITYHGETDVGKRRTLNEDAIFADDTLFIVCDGMGGHKAGEVASQVATDVIAGFVHRSGEDPEITWPYGFEPRSSHEGNRLRTAIKLANRAVFRKSASSDDYTGMGTTVVAVLVSSSRPEHMTYASVGDSRVYLIRSGAIEQLTHDDSWLNMAWDAGTLDNSTRASMKNVLTKALGSRQDVDFEVGEHELADGDTILLCSDGLTNMLSDGQILDIVSRHGRDLGAACRELVSAANAEGGRDNISVVLVHYAA